MPSVLMLFEYATLNGGEQSALSVLSGIRDAGFDVTAAAPAKGPLADELAAHRVELAPLTLHDRDGQRLPRAEILDQLRELIRHRSPDIVHANSISMSRLAGPVVQELGVPSIGHLRDILHLSAGAVHDLNRHTRLLAVSAATKDWHVADGLDPHKTHVLHNGVDLDAFQPGKATGCLHRQLSLPPAVGLVGAIGQIGMRKGLDVLLDAAAVVIPGNNDVHFVLVGERQSQKQEAVHFEAELQRRAAQPPLADRVHFVGRRDDIPQLLNEFTLLAHAARQEPLGRVLLEAAASGTPVVATDVGGTREIFPAAANAAKLVIADDAQRMANAIGEVLASAALRKTLSKNSRSRAGSHFDVRRVISQLTKHYRAIAN